MSTSDANNDDRSFQLRTGCATLGFDGFASLARGDTGFVPPYCAGRFLLRNPLAPGTDGLRPNTGIWRNRSYLVVSVYRKCLGGAELRWKGNGFIESFNRRLRDECLNVEWFTSLEEACRGLALWRDHYNHHRPHNALDDRSRAVFAALHGIRGKRFALFDANKANGKPRQGFASPAQAPLTRLTVCLKILDIRAKHFHASLKPETLC